MSVRRLPLLGAAVLLGATLLPALASPPAPGVVRIEVLSNRADLISGGNALVRLGTSPADADAEDFRLEVEGRDVSNQLVPMKDGTAEAELTGLRLGANVVTAQLPDGRGARITITNHPIGGPVFSGPQIQPWACSDGAKDAQCNRPATYEFLYKSTDPTKTGLQDYDPENPPSDVAETTTDHEVTVPFIVRVERGVIARDNYAIAVLFQPDKPWQPTAPQPQFNHKLLVTHGASCDTEYQMAGAPSVTGDQVAGNSPTLALSRGFAVMSHALNNAGHNCNIVTEAEAMVMTKEHLVETYGTLRYTIGTGCSGGSLAQQQVANAYPGFYQGILPACSFTDSWSSAMQKDDYILLRRYFETPTLWDPTAAWTPPQMSQIYDHPNPTNPITFTEVIPTNHDPSRDCPGVPPDDVYDPGTNPDGVRCAIADYMVNIFGRRSDGKAGRAMDNVGIQYGLRGFKAGLVTPAQFVDVNVKIGSHDIDFEHTLARREADRPALERAFRSGAVDIASNLDQVAIIDLRGPDPGAFHDVYRTYAMRERLIREHGHADNQVLWRGQVPLFGDTTFTESALLAMDEWLASIDGDMRAVPLAQKIVEGKPESLTERCTNGAGVDLPASECDAIVQSYGAPRFQAGMPLADDTIKCQLQPIDRADYPALLTDAQFDTLKSVFPTGVCDYTKPSVDKTPTVPWLTYADTVGGRPLGAVPVSVPFRSAPIDGGAPQPPGAPLPATGGAVATGAGGLLALVGAGLLRRRLRRRA